MSSSLSQERLCKQRAKQYHRAGGQLLRVSMHDCMCTCRHATHVVHTSWNSLVPPLLCPDLSSILDLGSSNTRLSVATRHVTRSGHFFRNNTLSTYPSAADAYKTIVRVSSCSQAHPKRSGGAIVTYYVLY